MVCAPLIFRTNQGNPPLCKSLKDTNISGGGGGDWRVGEEGKLQDAGKGGVEFKAGSLHGGLTILAVLVLQNNQGPLNGGGFKRGGFPIWTCPSFFVLFRPFLSFFVLSRFFWDFPGLRGDGPGIFPMCPFPLSQPIKSICEEQSRKGPRSNLDLSRKKWETPGFGNTPV